MAFGCQLFFTGFYLFDIFSIFILSFKITKNTIYNCQFKIHLRSQCVDTCYILLNLLYPLYYYVIYILYKSCVQVEITGRNNKMWFVCQVKVTTGGMYTKMFIVFHYTWGCEWGFIEGNYRQKNKEYKK